MRKKTIMTPRNRRWKELDTRLAGPKACNFTQKGFHCSHGSRRPFTRAILREMGGFDIAATLEFFTQCGGGCDCEVALNVARAWANGHRLQRAEGNPYEMAIVVGGYIGT